MKFFNSEGGRFFEVRRKLESLIQETGAHNPSFEAYALLEKATGFPKAALISDKERVLTSAELERLEEFLSKRLDGYPIQYILKEWDFLGLAFSVGEGVLIPRPETELLCERVAEHFKTSGFEPAKIKGVDLCTGSGCVGLGIASLLEPIELSVSALEFSFAAFGYLEMNCRRYENLQVKPIFGDIFAAFETEEFLDRYDFIVSNPPYLRNDEMAELDKNVRYEPKTALNGGDDGLLFYRVIAEKWLPKLQEGGICAVEVGIGQAAEVRNLFLNSPNFSGKIDVGCDYNGIERVVAAVKER